MDLPIKDIPVIVRDLFVYLVYMFCGFLIINNIYYVFYGSNYNSYGEKILQVSDYVTENTLILILFLITSLILGYVCEQLFGIVPIKCKKEKPKEEEGKPKKLSGDWDVRYNEIFKRLSVIHRKENFHLLNLLRDGKKGLKITRSIGGASLISSAILPISFKLQNFKLFNLFIVLFFFAITIGFYCKLKNDECRHQKYIRYISNFLKETVNNEKKQ